MEGFGETFWNECVRLDFCFPITFSNKYNKLLVSKKTAMR